MPPAEDDVHPWTDPPGELAAMVHETAAPSQLQACAGGAPLEPVVAVGAAAGVGGVEMAPGWPDASQPMAARPQSPPSGGIPKLEISLLQEPCLLWATSLPPISGLPEAAGQGRSASPVASLSGRTPGALPPRPSTATRGSVTTHSRQLPPPMPAPIPISHDKPSEASSAGTLKPTRALP